MLTRQRPPMPLVLASRKVSTPHTSGEGTRGLWSWLFLGVQNPSFLLTAPSYCHSVSPPKRLRRWMLGGWSGENLALVRPWEMSWNCQLRFEMPQVPLFGSWKMPSATQSFPVPWRRNSCMLLSTHLFSPEGSRRRTAAFWSLQWRKRLPIYFAQDRLSRFLALLTFPKPKNLAFAGGWISSSTFWNRTARV